VVRGSQDTPGRRAEAAASTMASMLSTTQTMGEHHALRVGGGPLVNCRSARRQVVGRDAPVRARRRSSCRRRIAGSPGSGEERLRARVDQHQGGSGVADRLPGSGPRTPHRPRVASAGGGRSRARRQPDRLDGGHEGPGRSVRAGEWSPGSTPAACSAAAAALGVLVDLAPRQGLDPAAAADPTRVGRPRTRRGLDTGRTVCMGLGPGVPRRRYDPRTHRRPAPLKAGTLHRPGATAAPGSRKNRERAGPCRRLRPRRRPAPRRRRGVRMHDRPRVGGAERRSASPWPTRSTSHDVRGGEGGRVPSEVMSGSAATGATGRGDRRRVPATRSRGRGGSGFGRGGGVHERLVGPAGCAACGPACGAARWRPGRRRRAGFRFQPRRFMP